MSDDKKFEEMDARLEAEIIERMGAISSELAHDLRSPLQTIQNAIYLIKRNPENEQLYDMVRDSLLLATEILDSFREYYKAHIIQRLQIDPVKVVDLSFSEVEVPESITLSKDYGDTEPINIDPSKTALALRKLIQNALEAMPDGGSLTVSLRDHHDYIVLKVSDTGGGIPDSVADVIYTPFESGPKNGRGLGVPTSKRIIESHGGVLSYESHPEEGTVWTVKIPRSSVNL